MGKDLFHYKKYEFKTKEDYVNYLRRIILGSSSAILKLKKLLDRYELYLKEVTIGLQKGNLPHKAIETLVHDNYVDPILGIQSYLLNVIGDDQNIAISYKKFRRLALKSNDFNLRQFDEVETTILNRIYKLRCWYNHVPESSINAIKIKTEKDELEKESNNPIELLEYKYVSLEYCVEEYNNSLAFYVDCKFMIKRMVEDYAILLSEKVENIKIIKLETSTPRNRDILDLTYLSAKIQGL